MKIDDASNKLPNLPAAVPATGRTAVGKTDEWAPSGNADRVCLSGTLQSLSASADAPIDAGKVETLRAAIADGSFRVDAGRIADGLIAASRELLASHRSPS